MNSFDVELAMRRLVTDVRNSQVWCHKNELDGELNSGDNLSPESLKPCVIVM